MTEETYIRKWLEGKLTEEERQAFEKTETYASLSKMQDALEAYKAPEYDTESAYAALAARMKNTGSREIRVNWLGTALRVAAVITLLIVSYVLIFTEDVRVVETGMAEMRTVVLPDSSLVVLNALSELRFDEDEWNDVRKVELQGEAFFQVAKGSDFKVFTDNGTVTVLGTRFNVKDRKEFYEVICYEGLVNVQSTGRDENLPPDHIFQVVDGSVVTGQNDFYAFPHLLKNESAFYSVPLGQVLDEIERYYGVEITRNNVDEKARFTGRFTHSNLMLALQSVTLPMNLTYQATENGKRIIITGEDQ